MARKRLPVAAATALAALAALVFAALPARAEMDRTALFKLSASVLKIEARRAQGGYALGSGVVVAADTIVTNCHVTRDALSVSVLRGSARWVAESQRSDFDHDLCLLHVPGLEGDVVPLGRAEALAPGQAVTALGYTGGLGIQNSDGEVLGLHRLDGARVIRSSNWFSSGASGGGLFDADLRLVGILTFRLRGGEAHYFSAPSEWLQSMLDAPQKNGYRAIEPDRSAQPAYWQKPVVEQPRFLKAALLLRDDRWSELASLADEWARADATDAEPWYLMGVALDQMDQLPQAQRALECALAIEPASAEVRARLAPLYQRQQSAERSAGGLNRLAADALTPAASCSVDTPSPQKP